MTATTPTQLNSIRLTDPKTLLIDVRSAAEFEEVHAEGAINIPLHEFNAEELIEQHGLDSGRPVYLICGTGGRSKKACDALKTAGLNTAVNVNGGTNAWVAAGLPSIHGLKQSFSIQRQVQITAGSIALTGALLSFLNPMWAILPTFIGAGLVFSGLTNTCGMGMMLAMMPWNQAPKKKAADDCDTGG